MTGRERFIAELKELKAKIEEELDYTEAQYELASCLPTLEDGYERHHILVKMNVTGTAAQLGGRIELLEARLDAAMVALDVMTAEA